MVWFFFFFFTILSKINSCSHSLLPLLYPTCPEDVRHFTSGLNWATNLKWLLTPRIWNEMNKPLTCSAELLLPHSVSESNYTNTAQPTPLQWFIPSGKLIFSLLLVPGWESRLKTVKYSKAFPAVIGLIIHCVNYEPPAVQVKKEKAKGKGGERK